MKNKIFENLFVLELANNHWGDLERGKEIVRQFAKIVKENKIKALGWESKSNFDHELKSIVKYYKHKFIW
jgi:N-acetylneuraminate synthase